MSCNCDGPKKGPKPNPNQASYRRPPVTVYNTPTPNYTPPMPPYSDYPEYPNYPYYPY